VVLLQNSLLTGEVQNCAGAEMLSVRQKRMLWCGAFYGMILASGMMAVCWIWNVPLAVAGLAIAAVRLPIIWQYGKMRVY
jgi:hypothetical protein